MTNPLETMLVHERALTAATQDKARRYVAGRAGDDARELLGMLGLLPDQAEPEPWPECVSMVDAYESGLTVAQVAARFGVGTRKVSAALNAAGVVRHGGPRR